MDVRVMLLVIEQPDAVKTYLDQHPTASAPLAAVAAHFETIRKHGVSLVNDIVYANLAGGLLVGIAVPVVLLGLFRLVLWLIERRAASSSQ